ncbi:MAG: glycosyltransferase family 2 protein [Paracoccaceae bacterium]
MQTVAAVTMVRDDPFFLATWLRHYGEQFGRENCYIVNHGRGSQVADMAAGCNVIGIPGDPHPKFDRKRWQLLNGIVEGLRQYYRYVIVGDVDELLVLDPEAGTDLKGWIAQQPARRVLTPLGLEVIHRIDLEPDPVTDQILGPRMHVRPAPHYSKPCLLSFPTRLSRGGHFSVFPELHTPDELYLLHLKFCDFGVYCETMDQRNAVTKEIGTSVQDTMIGRHWFETARGEDRDMFESFSQLDMQEGFDLRWLRRKMHRSWKPRANSQFFQFDRPNYRIQYRLPDRFAGVI